MEIKFKAAVTVRGDGSVVLRPEANPDETFGFPNAMTPNEAAIVCANLKRWAIRQFELETQAAIDKARAAS